MPYFDYRQNNSGGRFQGPAITVIIEARDAEEADRLAEREGLYFGGGGDCPCCGDRWSPAWGDGDPVPSRYGQPITEDCSRYGVSRQDGIPSCLIVHLDGRRQSW